MCFITSQNKKEGADWAALGKIINTGRKVKIKASLNMKVPYLLTREAINDNVAEYSVGNYVLGDLGDQNKFIAE